MAKNNWEEFCIHPDYVEQEISEWTHFDDRAFADEWQNEVYQLAYDEFSRRGYRTVIDFGCGSGYKLVKLFPPGATIGIELEPALSFLKQKYPRRMWRSGSSLQTSLMGGDLLICSDVLEHMPDPNALLRAFADSECEMFVLSTPALELMAERGMSVRMGPPTNKSHIREWTTVEFRKLVSRQFKVLRQVITNLDQCTQTIVAVKR